MTKIKIVSLVPSWTETLLRANVQVVGRTRFCIHPADLVPTIPAVGGTKDVDWQRVQELRPDFVLLDREENTLAMSESCPFPQVVTHVKHLQDLPVELGRLATHFREPKLGAMAERWERVLRPDLSSETLLELPGVTDWLREPSGSVANSVFYVIWKNPWMLASSETFIGSVLEKLLGENKIPPFAEKYPKIEDLKLYDSEQNLFLFSSEPFPFTKFRKDLLLEVRQASVALVDGECFSWFGIRSLEFLEGVLKKNVRR